MLYRILIEQDEDGVFIAECASSFGWTSRGKKRKEEVVEVSV